MKRCFAFLLAFALLLWPLTIKPAEAQSLKDQLVGSWSLVSNTEEYADGKKEPWGPDAKGMLVFDKNGQFSLQIGVGDRPKGSGNPAENPAGKFIGYFGTYVTNDADKTLSFQIVRATFPSWDGTEQKRAVTSVGDQLIYKSAAPIPSGKGPFVPVLVWKRQN